MKKTLFTLFLLLAVVAGASAQSWKDALGKMAGEAIQNKTSEKTGDMLTNVLGSLLGNSMNLTMSAIEGKWEYNGVACILESENALSNIGGTLVTTQIEEKLNGVLAKVGVSSGGTSFTFNKDTTCVIVIGNYNLKGKYEVVPEEKVINFSFMHEMFDIKTQAAYEIYNLNIVFNADKLLALVKSVTSFLSKNAKEDQKQELNTITATATSVGALLNAYDGMMLGAKLKRESVAAPATSIDADDEAAPSSNADSDKADAVKSIIGTFFK